MTHDKKNSRTTREEERLNEGGREFGHVHQPSQTGEASNRRGVADDVTPSTGTRQQTPGQRREGVKGSHRGSGTQQSRPPGSAQHTKKKAA